MLYLQENSSFAAFKLMIKPNGKSFGKSRGCGIISLKCEDDLSLLEAQLKFSITIGKETRGPFSHNFALRSIAELPKDEEVWDLLSAEDAVLQTVRICLQVEITQPEVVVPASAGTFVPPNIL